MYSSERKTKMKTSINYLLNTSFNIFQNRTISKRTIIALIILSVTIACSQNGSTKENLNANQVAGIFATLGKPNAVASSSELNCAPSYLAFNFNSNEKIIISFPVKNGNDPYVGAKVEIYDSKNSLITSGVTDSNGIYTDTVTLFDGQNLYAKVIAIGVPAEPFLIYSNEKNTISQSGQVLNCKAANADLRILTVSAFDNNGILAITQTNQTVSTKLLQAVNFAFPETQDIRKTHPEYIMTGVDTNLKLSELADVWVTFLHEGAGYRNSFGYFTYTDDSKPTSPSAVNKIALFPNASYKNSGGNLSSGDKVFLGRFPANTRIGFWIISDGWDGSKIVETKNNIFSLPELNNETNAELKKHLAMLWYEDEKKIILGFEDLPRDAAVCDHDFNDVVFTVTVNPVTAINLDNIVKVPGIVDSDGDGVADNNDPFPNDPNRTYTRYYPGSDTYAYLAFEDLYPSKGDYDFNDLVVSFRIKEILDRNKNVKEFSAEFNLKAMGAANQNGLMLMLETIATNVESSQRTVNGIIKDNAIEPGHTDELVFKIIDNARNQIQIPSGFAFANTITGSPQTNGDKIVLNATFVNPIIDSSPYNPFLFNVKTRSKEIHLPNKRPSSFFDTKLFNTGDDKSNLQNKIFFKDNSGYPWAMLVGPDFQHPSEKSSIKKAYPNFQNWINSNGTLFKNWVTNKSANFIYK